ncbi:TIGR04211 family SH3 domain-containing protein [Desulfobacterales bacterium HSG2]|nr:TIGR04211 family SH3 domain-containing protein [Desulfobacterales bacterium HSG2]
MKNYVFIGICLLLFATTSAQAVMYVKEIEITMRTGPGNHRQIIAMLSSGQKVSVLERGEGWTNVRIPDGKEGWVLSQYLTSKRPAKYELEVLKKEHESLSVQVASLIEENRKLKTENKKLLSEFADSEKTFDKLNKSYESLKGESADFLRIKSAYQKVSEQLAEQMKKAENLEKKLAKIQRERNLKWYLTEPAQMGFLCGAAVLVAGLLIGVFVGRAKRGGRRSSLM